LATQVAVEVRGRGDNKVSEIWPKVNIFVYHFQLDSARLFLEITHITMARPQMEDIAIKPISNL
jgi:hypothetical protein